MMIYLTKRKNHAIIRHLIKDACGGTKNTAHPLQIWNEIISCCVFFTHGRRKNFFKPFYNFSFSNFVLIPSSSAKNRTETEKIGTCCLLLFFYFLFFIKGDTRILVNTSLITGGVGCQAKKMKNTKKEEKERSRVNGTKRLKRKRSSTLF